VKRRGYLKVLPFFLSFALMLSLAAAAGAAGSSFEDTGDSWAAEDIDALSSLGIYDGMIFEEDSLFKPEQPITRAEFLLLVFNAMGLDHDARDQSLTAPFVDYKDAPSAYQPYLVEGYHRGILQGKPTSGGGLSADWNGPLTRQEAVTLIGRILNTWSDRTLDFTDSEHIAQWAYSYVAALTEKEILNGLPDGSFAPSRHMTRAEASHVVNLLVEGKVFFATEMRVFAGSTDLGSKDGERLAASFGAPFGLAIGNDRSILVADRDANLLRRIASDMVTTFAGQTEEIDINGMPVSGYKDSVSVTELLMRGPRYISQARDGTIYYTDGGNNTLRMIRTDGNGYTVSGSGKAGYVNGSRENTQFNLPSGVAVGADGTVYVADTLNNCIRTVSGRGATALYAGVPGETGGYKDGSLTGALFCEPTDIQFGADGALYVADTGNSMIRVIKNGTVSTLAGKPTGRDADSGVMIGGYLDGPADEALFCGPLGLFVDASGIVIVADTENNVIRKIEAGFVTTLAGNLTAGNSTGPALVSMLNSPTDVVMLDGKVYVSDTYNHIIKIFGSALD